MPFKGPLKGL